MNANTAHKTRPSEAPGPKETNADRKAKAGLQARAALAGYELTPLADGGFVASRWGLLKALADTADVEAFLRRVGAPGA